MNYAQNPVHRGFYPDPSVCTDGTYYYMVNSTFAYLPGIPVFRSSDLVSWEQIGHVLTEENMPSLEEFAHHKNMHIREGVYAPTIRYHEGTFYMVTTVEPGDICFYCTAKDPAGPWSQPYVLEGAQGIDPSFFFDGKICWLIGQRQKENGKYFGDSEIWAQGLVLDRHALVGPKYSLWDGAAKKTWWTEGPHLYKRGEWYYLVVAECGTEYDHSVNVARSRQVTGPYESCPWNPIFTHRHLGHGEKIQNVGHADFLETASGDWFAFMLGTRPVKGCDLTGRETFIADVSWEEDWPVINAGEGKLREWQPVQDGCQTPVSPVPGKDLRIEWKLPRDLRLVTPRDIRHFGPEHMEFKGDQLVMKGEQELHALVRCEEVEFETWTTLDCEQMAAGQSAGLELYYEDESQLKLAVIKTEEGMNVQLLRTMHGHRMALPVEEAGSGVAATMSRPAVTFAGEGAPSRVVLRCHVAAGQAAFTLWGTDRRVLARANADASFLCPKVSGGFTGCMVGVGMTPAQNGSSGSAVFGPLSVNWVR